MTAVAIGILPDSPAPSVRVLPRCKDCGRTDTDRIKAGGTYVWGHLCSPVEPDQDVRVYGAALAALEVMACR